VSVLDFSSKLGGKNEIEGFKFPLSPSDESDLNDPPSYDSFLVDDTDVFADRDVFISSCDV
jgi:hypothetical protein